jgi:hypothetical protein
VVTTDEHLRSVHTVTTTVVWLPLVLTVPWLALAALWQLGRTHGNVPAWAAPAHAREHEGLIVTPGGVATALAHLGIGKLIEAIKKGWEVEFLTPPVRVNRHRVSLQRSSTPKREANVFLAHVTASASIGACVSRTRAGSCSVTTPDSGWIPGTTRPPPRSTWIGPCCA